MRERQEPIIDIEWTTSEEVEHAAHETRREASLNNKAATPQERWNMPRKVAYFTALGVIATLWTAPLILGSIVGLMLLVIPGLIMIAIGCMPILLMLGYYWGDTFFEERRPTRSRR